MCDSRLTSLFGIHLCLVYDYMYTRHFQSTNLDPFYTKYSSNNLLCSYNFVFDELCIKISVCRPFHFIRFIGTSPFSSNVRSMLRNLCQQVTVDIATKTISI